MIEPREEEIDLTEPIAPKINTNSPTTENSVEFLDDEEEYGPFQIHQSDFDSTNNSES
jgi:hypothetical protein